MLEYVSTSLFDSPAETLVNTVNTVGVMGKGIAAEFKRRYPEMFLRYKEYCERGALDIGQLYLYKTPNKWVLNFPTKKHWRNPSKVEYIEAGLSKFVQTYTEWGITSISFPQLGCGNGDLQWRVVRPVMESYLKNLPIPVYIHLVARRSDFIPEHLDLDLVGQPNAARMDIGFEQFWSDLSELNDLGDRDLTPLQEDFMDLWNSLRLRGALRRDSFPGALQADPDFVMNLLLQLAYIRYIQFAEHSKGQRPQRIPGVQLVLPPGLEEPPITVLEI